jgi:hypothetical protein
LKQWPNEWWEAPIKFNNNGDGDGWVQQWWEQWLLQKHVLLLNCFIKKYPKW